MKLFSVYEFFPGSSTCLQILVDDVEEHIMVVPVGQDIRRRTADTLTMPAPYLEKLAVNVLWKVISYEVNHHFEVYLESVHDGEYTSYLVDATAGRRYPIHTGEGLLLANTAHLPIYVEKSLFDQMSSTWKPTPSYVPVPLSFITEELLGKILQEAIDRENYDEACKIRDEIEARKKRKQDAEDHKL